MPLPRRRKTLPLWVSGRNLDLRGAVERRNLDLAAERGGGEADRHLAVQVVVVALEDRVRPSGASGRTGRRAGRRSRRARPRRTGGCGRPRRRLPGSSPPASCASSPGRRRCRWRTASGIILPLPWQRGQVCWIEKKPCCMRTWPWPWQVGQVCGLVPGLAPAAVAGLARLRGRDADLGLGAARGLLERDLEVVAQIRAAVDASVRERPWPKMSLKMSPKASAKPPKPAAPAPAAAGSTPAWP